MTTSTLAHPDLDTASGVLASLRQAQERVDAAEADKLQLAVAWAAMHSEDGLVGPASTWEQPLPLAGQGAPVVAEFCVPELACALGLSAEAGRGFLADAIELRHRLPRLFARVVAGELRAWRARRVAQTTTGLSAAAAGFVDAHVAPVAHKIGPVLLDRLVQEARARCDPEDAEARRLAAAESRRFDVHARQLSTEGAIEGAVVGTVEVSGVLDLADALDLERAVAAGAAALAAAGSTESLDVRRSLALGALARGESPAPPGAPRSRRLVLHVHLADPAVARVEQPTGMVSVAQVRSWCTDPATDVTIQPVIDLAGPAHTDAYEIPHRIREQVILRDHTCVFPWCTRSARRSDLDHLDPWPHGPTDPDNLAPLCRRHHRAKTHAGWTYTSPEPGRYQWRSPHGYHYQRDPTGTTDLT